MNTLGYYRMRGCRVTAYCQASLTCRHGANLDLDALIERFGFDYNVPEDHCEFICRLVCTKCGAREASIIIGSGSGLGGFNGIGGHGLPRRAEVR